MTYDRNLKLILVEDDVGHAKLIEKNLRRANVRNPILHFDSGRAFINFFFKDNHEAKEPDPYLILLDLNLPETDGYEILRLVKTDPVKKEVPVVILTTTSDPQEIQRCHQLGCDMYITKPMDYKGFDQVAKKLATVITTLHASS